MAALNDLLEAQQKLIEDLRGQAQALEARGGSGDKEAAEALFLKINAMQSKLNGLRARQGEDEYSGFRLNDYRSEAAAFPREPIEEKPGDARCTDQWTDTSRI